MNNKVDSLLSDNEYLKECLDKIVNKLNAWLGGFGIEM